jgi:hypothetical protein
MLVRAASLGFSVHTGWASMVAIGGAPGDLELLLRCRLELLPANGVIPRFVYHEAAERDLAAAEKLVAAASQASGECAANALQALKIRAARAGIPAKVQKLPPDLVSILAAHPKIHAAEGVLFQQALIHGCRAAGIRAVTATETEIWQQAAAFSAMSEEEFRHYIDGLKKKFGSPWSADEKLATAAAIMARSAKVS